MQPTGPAEEDGEIFKQAAALLRGLVVSSGEGVVRHGVDLDIFIDPRWNDDDNCFDLLLTFYAHGRRTVDWQGLLVVIVLADDGNTPISTGRLDHRGHVMIRGLTHSSFQLLIQEIG